MSISSDAQARLELSMVVEPGDPRLRRFRVDYSAGEIMHQLCEQKHGMPSAWISNCAGVTDRAQALLEHAESLEMRWIAAGTPEWPEELDDLDHLEAINGAAGAPLGLWVRGPADLARLCTASVAVVGARDATSYGCEVASDIAAHLAAAGHTVVSGAAFGVDVCAHRGALSVGGPTVAVLAGGADVPYPRAHSAILDRIAEDAAVVSEQLPGRTPIKSRFLSRNRLIAAVTAGTVVVEAARRSGSLNTLNWADQLGRASMGVPGPITSPASVGVHEAIRTGKAQIVAGGDEVIEAIGGFGASDATPPRSAETVFDGLPVVACRILDSLPWGGVLTAVDISNETGVPIRDLNDHLLGLEEKGLVNHTLMGWSLQQRADTMRRHGKGER